MPSTKYNSYFALIDCNNFFASCEQVFAPHLVGKPLVILSNNDGCIVARSREAKALGIQMGEPFFKVEAQLRAHGVCVLSANFSLYADMSERVMTTLEGCGYPVEVYSIDEAFLELPNLTHDEMESLAKTIRQKIQQWIGLPIAVGIAPTKTLAKAANEIAKKGKGYCVWSSQEAIDTALLSLPMEDVWGIGRQLSSNLRSYSIRTVSELISREDSFLQKRFSVTLVRTVWELRGISCFHDSHTPEQSKSITCSRAFGKKIKTLSEMQEAVATYTSRAAARLREQSGCAGLINLFICTDHFHTQSASLKLPSPTSYTPEFIHYAHQLLSSLFKQGTQYRKAGIILGDIIPEGEVQLDLFHPVDNDKRVAAMQVMDAINQRWEQKPLRFAAEGIDQPWKGRSSKRSSRFTTCWKELPVVQAKF